MNAQLELIEQSELELIKCEMKKVKESSENVRKGLFARHNELAKMYLEQKEELEKIKALIYGQKKENFGSLSQLELQRVC